MIVAMKPYICNELVIREERARVDELRWVLS